MENTLYITQNDQGFELDNSNGDSYGFVSDTLEGAIELCKELIERTAPKLSKSLEASKICKSLDLNQGFISR